MNAPTELVANRHVAAQSLRILICEDAVINQRVASRLLEREGYQVDIAANGTIAVEKFRSESWDVILMDVQMPELDGFEATRCIRQLEDGRTHVPIIAMTAHAMKGDRERCISAGMDGYLSKPFAARELYEAVQQALADCKIPLDN
jgi:two-component system, sensor histidine kinase and response regulator